MNRDYLKIGYIVETHALKGALKIKPTTSFIGERFEVGNKVLVKNNTTSNIETLTIQSVREQKGLLIVSFAEIDDISIAENYLKGFLFINKKGVTLEEGYFFFDDLLGMKVILEDKTLIGKVIEILEYAAYHTLRVEREDGSNILIPYIEEFIISTDLASKTIVFRPIEGML
ncbi:MAG: Ribosome maturation factor RimM [Tenericutes bacterium ADurb.Bin087]|nr:MAG: Ribosome maturation factor RimM [Tenericutes bacterium ADurb.Bin087]